jgi:O-antigen ligase
VSEGLRGRIPASWYLALLLCAPVAYSFGLTVAPRPIGGGVLAGPILLLTLVVCAVGAWALAAPEGQWSALARVWFVLVILQWLYLAVSTAQNGGRTDLAATFVPLGIMLLWLRPPGAASVWRAADVFAVTVVAASVLVLALEVAHVIPSWYEALGGYVGGLAAGDRESHWFALGSVLGLDGRWGGLGRDPNYAGPLGAFLVVYGFARPVVLRLVLVVSGLLFVVLADSRAAYAAVAVGLLVLVVLPGKGVRWNQLTGTRIAEIGIGLLMGGRLISDLIGNPAGTLSMTGRTSMWPEFVSLFPESPMIGVGSARIGEAVANGTLPPWAFHGHNQYVDGLVRYGAIGLTFQVTVMLLAVAIVIMGAIRGSAYGLAALMTVLVATVTNLLLDWRVPSIELSAIFVAVLIAEASRARKREVDVPSSPA